MPLAVGGYFFLNGKGKYRLAQAFIIGMSLWFYSYANLPLLFLILGSLCGNYLCSFCMEKIGKRKLFGILGVAFNLGLLFYFKYYDFFISNMNALLKQSWALKHIVLPMGISFYTFQQISFIVDRMWGKAEHYHVLDYAAFVTYFPQLVAGPIVQHNDLVPQFQDRSRKKFCWVSFSKGIKLFVFGLSKKVLIADILALAVDYGFGNIDSLDSVAAAFVALSFTLQLYFDFSGYSDMAIGLGWMMNIDLPMNFDTPFRSHTVAEFWRRWHITLNRFFTTYVYIPLGGSRKGELRTIGNLFLFFFLSGLWHGANWTFVLWGVCHGIGVVFDHLFKKYGKVREPGRLQGGLQTMRTFIIVVLLYTVFRSDSIAQAGQFFERLTSFTWTGALANVAVAMDNAVIYIPLTIVKRINAGWFEATYLVYYGIMLFLALYLSFGKSAYRRSENGIRSRIEASGLAILFAACVISLSKVVVFLYSNF